ncbi:MAG: hypothetical protein JOY61_05620 [Chloroflexi bacterium]|nr:hypothetical protein [Chloroflexota bacterium]
MTDQFQVDLDQLGRVAQGLHGAATNLDWLDGQLSRLEGQIAAAGPLARRTLATVGGARRSIGSSARHLADLHADVQQRARLLADSQQDTVQDGVFMNTLQGAPASVADWSAENKLQVALERAAEHLPGDVADQLRALLTPENIAALVAILGVWAAAQAFGVGEIVDLILAVGGIIALGPDAIRAVQDLVSFATGTFSARTDADLDAAGAHLASAVAIIGVDGALALLAHKASGSLGDSVPRVQTGGADMVTPEGVRVGTGGAPLNDGVDPAVIRQDDDFSARLNSRGVPKSYLDDSGALVPADPQGDITPYEHVLGASPAKDASPFTSFSTAPSAKSYGSMQVELDLPRLQQDIASGQVQGVQVLTTPDVQAQIAEEIHSIAPEADINAATGPGTPDAIDAYVRTLNLSNTQAIRITGRLRAYMYVGRDGEVLVKGTIPPGYLTDPAPVSTGP